MLRRLGLQEGEAITHPWINKALEKAQGKVEARNFEIRKQLLRFDNVMNEQRKVIYEQRREIMQAEEVRETIVDMRHETIANLVAESIPPNSYAEQWETQRLTDRVKEVLGLELPVADWAKEEGIAETEIEERIREASDAQMAEKEASVGTDMMRTAEKSLLLQILDQTWKEHLLALDYLRQGITLRAYGQRDPLREYQQEAFDMFELMLTQLRENITRVLCRVEFRVQRPEDIPPPEAPAPDQLQESRTDPALAGLGGPPAPEQGAPGPAAAGGAAAAGGTVVNRAAAQIDPNDPSTWGKVPRNAPCPCGSGKKFKHCHGAAGAGEAETPARGAAE
jgi:preprotein translocase subunit SecA